MTNKTERQRLVASRRYREWFLRPRHVHYAGRKRDGIVRCPGCWQTSSRWICIGCRKAWTRAKTHARHTATCPHCGQALIEVHKDLRAPRRNNVKAWRRLARRYRN